nr:cell division control protein 42 homolog [Onthophagus taurus]
MLQENEKNKMDNNLKIIKIAVIGDGTVGKTNLLNRYTLNEPITDYEPTVFDNYSTEIHLGGKSYLLQLFDTSGQEEYDRLRKLSYVERDCIIICFAVNNKNSYQHVKEKWISDVRQSNKTAKILLVGTKSDLRDDPNEDLVDPEQGVKMMKIIKAKGYMECSSLRNDGVQNVFSEAIRIVLCEWQKRKRKCEIL